jgi:hypothetical protein
MLNNQCICPGRDAGIFSPRRHCVQIKFPIQQVLYSVWTRDHIQENKWSQCVKMTTHLYTVLSLNLPPPYGPNA